MAHRVASRRLAPPRVSAIERTRPTGQRRTRPIMAASMAPPAAEHDALADRCLDAALALSESAARAGFRGPDPFDGLWWHWPRALVGGRRRRQAIAQLHARCAVRPAPPLSPPPSAYRQGARGLRLGRGARAAPRARRCASGRRTARPADPRRRPQRRTGRLGLPVGRADAVELLPGGQPERRRHRLRGERAARGRRRAGSRRPRRSRARGRALGPRRALDRAGGLLRLSRGPAREHPQRQPPGRVAGRRRGWGGSPRPGAGGAGRAANARRAAPRWVVAVRRGAQSRVGGLLSLGLRAAVPGPPARRGRPRRRGGAAWRGALPRVLRRGRARAAVGGQAVSRGCALGRHGPEHAWPSSCVAGWSNASCSSAWRGASSITACAAGAPCTGATAGAPRPCATCAGATRTSHWGSSTPRRPYGASTTSRRAVSAPSGRTLRRSRRARSAPRSPSRSGRPGERR